jgi:hypothetical protein
MDQEEAMTMLRQRVVELKAALSGVPQGPHPAG